MFVARFLQIVYTGFIVAFLGVTEVNADASLMMVEELGCPYCERWKAEIGPIYPKTAEGRIAPLVKVMIHDPLPKGVTLTSPPIYTPRPVKNSRA